MWTEGYYEAVKSIFLKDGTVEVHHINAERGKGVFAEMDYKPGQSIFVESPLVAHKIVAPPDDDEEAESRDAELPKEDDLEGCTYCLRCVLPRDRFPLSDAIYKAIYSEGLPEGICCEHCGDEYYCSEDCRKVAWAHFHKLLCVGPNPSSDHPMLKLEALASECKRTNPLMIARIFAMVVQRVQTTDEDPRMAFAPFANFASNQEKFPHDMQALNYIEEQLFKDMSQAERAKFASVVNIEHFRLLNGAIMRNAQTICPVTDLHDFLSEASEEAKAPLLEAINRHLFEDDEDEGANEGSDEKSEGAHSKDTDKEVSRKGKEKDGEGKSNEGEENNKSKQEQSKEEFRFESIYEFLDCPIMRNLTVGAASGLFVFANSMNHSCAPNTIVVSCFNSFLIRVIAIKEIKKGEELCFSYIDEEAPYEERQRQLQKLYLFQCRCSRCETEGKAHSHRKHNSRKPQRQQQERKKTDKTKKKSQGRK